MGDEVVRSVALVILACVFVVVVVAIVVVAVADGLAWAVRAGWKCFELEK